jgi:hypothetical protein
MLPIVMRRTVTTMSSSTSSGAGGGLACSLCIPSLGVCGVQVRQVWCAGETGVVWAPGAAAAMYVVCYLGHCCCPVWCWCCWCWEWHECVALAPWQCIHKRACMYASCATPPVKQQRQSCLHGATYHAKPDLQLFSAAGPLPSQASMPLPLVSTRPHVLCTEPSQTAAHKRSSMRWFHCCVVCCRAQQPCAVCPFMIYGEVVQRWRLATGATLAKWPREAGEPPPSPLA